MGGSSSPHACDSLALNQQPYTALTFFTSHPKWVRAAHSSRNNRTCRWLPANVFVHRLCHLLLTSHLAACSGDGRHRQAAGLLPRLHPGGHDARHRRSPTRHPRSHHRGRAGTEEGRWQRTALALACHTCQRKRSACLFDGCRHTDRGVG